MYRRPKFLEELLEIRDQMSRDAFYDVDLFAEQVRSGSRLPKDVSEVSSRVGSKSKKKSKSRTKK